VGGTGNWDNSNTTHWSSSPGGSGGSSVPTLADDVIFDQYSGSGTCTAVGTGSVVEAKSLNFTGFTGTFTGTTPINIRGNLTLGSGMIYSNTGWFCIYDAAATITSNGIALTCGLDIDQVYASTTVTLADDLNCGGIFLKRGTFDANNNNVSCICFISDSIYARTLIMGSGTWSIHNTPYWSIKNASNLTLNCNTSTIKFINGTNDMSMSGGGKTYYNIWYNSPNGTGSFRMFDSNTFNNIKIDPGCLFSLTTGIIVTIDSLTANGTSGSHIHLYSSDYLAPWNYGIGTFLCTTGIINVNYCDITYLTATGGATWCANHSIDNGNNTGWDFNCGAGINNVINDYSINIYPNPANTSVTIDFAEYSSKNAFAEVYSIDGKLLQHISLQQRKTLVNISDYSSGVYIVKVSGNSGIAVKKMIKE
jgi:hypothetical protein